MLPRREIFLAVALTAAGAAVATVIEVLVVYVAMTTTLHSKYGLGFGAIYSAIGSGPIGRELAQTLLTYGLLIWPLAAWRLPTIASLGGLAVAEGLMLLVAGNAEIQVVIIATFVVGTSVIVLLRVFDWAYRRFGREKT